MAQSLSVEEYCRRAQELLNESPQPKAKELAITFYQKALDLAPNTFGIQLQLVHAYHTLGYTEAAKQLCDHLLEVAPNHLVVLFYRAMIEVPTVYALGEDSDSVRQRYQARLEKVAAAVVEAETSTLARFSRVVGTLSPLYLHHQGYDDRALYEIYGEIVHRLMVARYPLGANAPLMARPTSDEPLRIGIVSGNFHRCSSWFALIKGWFTCLNPQRFHLYAYALGKRADEETDYARERATKFVTGLQTLEEWADAIRQDQPHVLIYPELGTRAVISQLVALRLAPVQCAAPGTMVTSGLPTMDYFLSGELFESPEADTHYSEKLVRLPNLSYYYAPQEIAIAPVTRQEIGLRPSAILYHCLQAPFKFLPQYDSLYPRIAQAVGDCHFIFSQRKYADGWVARLRQRLRVAFADYGLDVDDYVVMLPDLAFDRYHGLNQLADVFLDTIAHSGGVTTLDALPYGLPMVTWPGPWLCGRTTQGILRRMGITETIATSADEYVDIAVRLGRDQSWREFVRASILQNRHKVYCDLESMRGLADFLDRVARA
jgi:predicted O-linked N-acetylglucosamine transferase (SPINDLY family)